MWENVIGISNEQAGTNQGVEALINAPTVSQLTVGTLLVVCVGHTGNCSSVEALINAPTVSACLR